MASQFAKQKETPMDFIRNLIVDLHAGRESWRVFTTASTLASAVAVVMAVLQRPI